jgi:ribA/ribD-fused uncharacterized protein
MDDLPVVFQRSTTCCFSNFHRVVFKYKSFDNKMRNYTSSEQAIMHYKALFFGDKEAALDIMYTSDPETQQRQIVKDFNMVIWNQQLSEVLENILYAKFNQNIDIAQELIKTGTRIIGALSEDKIWGIGLKMWDVRVENPKKWPGENRLGQTLMKVRERLL